MKRRILVSTSILSSDFKKLGEEIKSCVESGADMIHVDVMDGHFVPNITIGQVIVEAIRPVTPVPIEAHLMIENPWLYIDSFIDAGADAVIIHVECYGPRRANCQRVDQYPKEVDSIDAKRLREDLKRIRARGKKAWVVVNPGTPLCFDEVLPDVDGVLIMSVNPGFSKQKFMSEVLVKIEQLRKKFSGDISIDGGVNAETAPLAVKAGVNILATASYFFSAKDRKAAVEYLKKLG